MEPIRSGGKPGSTILARAGRWVFAVALSGSALAVGSVHTVTLCIVTLALGVAACMAWWGAEPMKTRSAANLLFFTGAGLTTYTALQCVPMPIGWLKRIAPHNADIWSRALAPLHEAGPTWAPISLDPTATRVEVL
ncbi:MAG: O-antigen ligase family protein, partial [Polyangiaceae bacterium]